MPEESLEKILTYFVVIGSMPPNHTSLCLTTPWAPKFKPGGPEL